MSTKVFQGERLRMIREQRGLNQQQLAAIVQSGPNQIGRYESGEADPSPGHLRRLAQALNVTTDYLLGLSDRPDVPLTEEQLSPDERRFLAALRRGKLVALRQLLDETLPQEQDQPQVPRVDITPNRNPLKRS